MAAKPKPLPEVIATGKRRESLEAIRDRLAVELDAAEGKTAADIAKELRATIAEIDRLPGGAEVTKLDRIAAGVADELALRRGAPRVPDAASS